LVAIGLPLAARDTHAKKSFNPDRFRRLRIKEDVLAMSIEAASIGAPAALRKAADQHSTASSLGARGTPISGRHTGSKR